MTFQTNLANSQKIKELIGEIETSYGWLEMMDGTHYLWSGYDDALPFGHGGCKSFDTVPSPSLSELAEVLKLVGEKELKKTCYYCGGAGESEYPQGSVCRTCKGTGKVYSSGGDEYMMICSLWFDSLRLGEEEANEVVNEKLAEILNQ